MHLPKTRSERGGAQPVVTSFSSETEYSGYILASGGWFDSTTPDGDATRKRS